MRAILSCLLACLVLSGCGAANNGASSHYDSKAAEANKKLAGYRYAYVLVSDVVSYWEETEIGEPYGVYEKTNPAMVNPSEIVRESLEENGYIVLYSLDEPLPGKCFVVGIEESRQRTSAFGTGIEMTIRFRDAETNRMLLTVTAEGIEWTKTNAARSAIRKCMKLVFPDAASSH